MGISNTSKEKEMSGFGHTSKVNLKVEFDIDKIIKDYKKVKKYMKSPLYTIKKMDGTEDIVSELIREYQENPID